MEVGLFYSVVTLIILIPVVFGALLRIQAERVKIRKLLIATWKMRNRRGYR